MLALSLPKAVEIGECWARDGLQSVGQVVSTEHKIAMINRFSELGFRHIEVTSFSNPKYLPQFADAVEVLKGIRRRPGVGYRVIVPNLRGMERLAAVMAEGVAVDEILFVCSASDAHSRHNTNTSQAEQLQQLEPMMKLALDTGAKVVGSVLTSFGCPIVGDVPVGEVLRIGRWFRDHGATWIQWGDTTGAANPRQVYEFYQYMFGELPGVEFIVHFHDTRGTGLANSLAAMMAGATNFDGSVGGIGGQPSGYRAKYQLGYTGNVVTEDMVNMFEEMGVQTGIDRWAVVRAAWEAERILGGPLRGQVARSGPVKHRPEDRDLTKEEA